MCNGMGYGAWTLHISKMATEGIVSVYDPDQKAMTYTQSLLREHGINVVPAGGV